MLYKKNYSQFLDVGCAEGYYAVGFAIRNRDAKVVAYDIEETARKLCLEIPKSIVEKNIVIKKQECTSEELRLFNFSEPTLLMCDCEGFELELFTENNVQNLSSCDLLLIEAHELS